MANEKRLIDLDKLIAYFEEQCDIAAKDTEKESLYVLAALKCCIDLFQNFPTIDVVEVVHSQWDTVFYERNGTLASYSHLCPECKYFYRDVRFKGHSYCPNCGAKMDAVTIQPLVPGHKDENDIAEMAFRNGEKHMKERVIELLKEQKGKALGVVRKTLDDVIRAVERVK